MDNETFHKQIQDQQDLINELKKITVDFPNENINIKYFREKYPGKHMDDIFMRLDTHFDIAANYSFEFDEHILNLKKLSYRLNKKSLKHRVRQWIRNL